MGDLYVQLFELNPAVELIVDPEDGLIVDGNRAACSFYGFAKRELVGKHLDEIAVSRPNVDRDTIKDILAGKAAPFAMQHRIASGQIRAVEVHAGPLVVDGRTLICAIVQDISERLNAERRLKESEETHRFVSEHATDMIARHDLQGRVFFVAGAARQLTGFDPGELLGKSPFDYIHEEDRAKVIARRTALVSSDDPEAADTATYEYRTVSKDGSLKWLETKSRVIRDPVTGRARETLAITRDVSDRVRAAQSSEESARRLEQLQRLESLSVLAGGIAHDFNNLLTVILQATEPTRHAVSDPAIAESIGHAYTAASRAASLCKHLLSYAGKRPLATETVDLADLVRSDADLLRASVDRRIDLEYELLPSAPLVKGDATALRQVLLNLVLNAAEAMSDRGGRIVVRTALTTLHAGDLAARASAVAVEPGTYVELSVRDTGSGMAKEVVDRVFEPFFTTKRSGRGLGLAAVLGIARSHGGTMEVDSEVGRGTTMRLLVPVAHNSERPAPPAPKRPSPPVRSLRVWVVDDEAPLRNLVVATLQRAGYQVSEAADGKAALELSKTSVEPDLAVVDVTMPFMSGDELVVALAARWPALPFVVMSGHDEEKIRALLDEKGARVVLLAKPFGLSELEGAVECALELARPAPVSIA